MIVSDRLRPPHNKRLSITPDTPHQKYLATLVSSRLA
jgi:hypothetical protein